MKNLKKAVSSIAAALIMMTAFSVVASASTELDINFRIEGPDSNIYYASLSVPYTGSLTAADAFDYLDEQSDELEFIGVSDGYISDVNGIGAGTFGGWDGWYYAVNNAAPSVGIGDYTLSDGDDLVLYYGGYPCQIPVADTSKLDSEGIISFTSNDVEYDADFNATQVVNKVVDATVTVNGSEFTTDENGEIKIPAEELQNVLSVQIDKKDLSGAPAVLRFAPDYTLSYNGVEDTDTASDTDKSSDTDTDSDTDTSSDTDKNTDSDKNTSSSPNTASSKPAAGTAGSSGSAKAAASTASAADSAQTGDGRTYIAIGVLVVAVVVVALMIVLKRKSGDK